MSCAICLSKLEEPVSIPCGHVYCSECLTQHISVTSTDGFNSTCPACREPFSILRPDPNALPKKLHPFLHSTLRRLFIEPPPPAPSSSSLKKKLASAHAHVEALEADKERLMDECERHMAAASAHSRGETEAVKKSTALENLLTRERQKWARWEDEREEETINNNRVFAELKAKYDHLKKKNKLLEAKMKTDNDIPHSVADLTTMLLKRTNSSTVDEASTPKRIRVIRPLPRTRLSLPAPTPLQTPAGRANCDLGSPFRT